MIRVSLSSVFCTPVVADDSVVVICVVYTSSSRSIKGVLVVKWAVQ